MSQDKNHIHKYMRVNIGYKKYPVFKCMIKGCGHYLPRQLVIGRESVCWRCNEVMTLTMKSTTLKKPHHHQCTRSVKVEAA